MRVAISLITLNEENYIERALKSCLFADFICVVDGGSTDKTKNIIKQFGRYHRKVKLLSRVVIWTDHFGIQRQFALDLIPPEISIDWWMRIDADEKYSQEFIDGIRPMLESLPEDILAVRIRQTNLYPDETHYAASHGGWETWPRIFRNLRNDEGPLLHWVGQVHEHVQVMTKHGLIDIPEEQIVTWNAQVYHYGWLEKTRREEREDLYIGIEGSGVEERGDLTEREYVIRQLPLMGNGHGNNAR